MTPKQLFANLRMIRKLAKFVVLALIVGCASTPERDPTPEVPVVQNPAGTGPSITVYKTPT